MSKISQTYVHHGRDFSVITRAEGEVIESLPAGTYRLNFNPARGWWFSEMQQFSLPSKLYGDTEKRSERILKTYARRMESGQPTGVLLEGMKGSGKTLLAKKVAIDSGLPVILINSPYTCDDFKEIISNVGPCVLIFDEFEKVYQDQSNQNAVLTLLDGVFSSQVLTFIIVNDSSYLVGPLKNRPGRLFYSLEYAGLSESFIIEYANDRLEPTMKTGVLASGDIDHEVTNRRIQGILSVSAMFSKFTFDHLQSVVEEMNRYNESAEEVIKYLNVKIPKPSLYDLYEVRIWKGKKEITSLQDDNIKTQNVCPALGGVHFSYYTVRTSDKKLTEYVHIDKENLFETDVKNQTFKFFIADENVTISYRKMGDKEYSKYSFANAY